MNMAVSGGLVLNSSALLDKFLQGVQSRAFRIAQIATGSSEDVLDLVQDAMFKLVEKYSERPEPQWENLSVERQQRLRRGANRFQQMQPQERERAKNQQQRFQSLSQQQQRIINQRFQRFNSLSRPQQRRLRNVQRRLQNMPQVERERLREQFEQQRQRNPRPEQNNGARSSTPEQRIRQVIRQNRNVLRPNRAQSPQRPNDTRPPNR